MKKLVLCLSALVVAAIVGFAVGRRSPASSLDVAWAQRFVKSPTAAGRVELGGEVLEGVVGVDGVIEACEVVEFRPGGDGTEDVIKLPGRFDFKNIAISFAMHKVRPNPVHDWFEKTLIAGELERKNGAVVIYDRESAEELLRYEFFEGFPCKWNVPDFSQDTGGLAIEKIEIAVERVERVESERAEP